MINKVKIFLKMDKEMKILISKAFYLTGYYRFSILFVPFNKLAKRIGTISLESTIEPEEVFIPYIRKVRKAVMMTGKNTPWESLCLVQALTVQKLLKKKRIDNTVYLGLFKDANSKVLAHAWIKCGNKVVVGEKGMEKFSVVAKFGSIYNEI